MHDGVAAVVAFELAYPRIAYTFHVVRLQGICLVIKRQLCSLIVVVVVAVSTYLFCRTSTSTLRDNRKQQQQWRRVASLLAWTATLTA